MFASLPKLADKNFVIGFLLPVLIAGSAGVLLFRDTAAVRAIQSALNSEQTLSDLTLVVVTVWSAAVLLLLFNFHIYRLLEGYEGPLHQWRAGWKRQRCRFNRTVAKIKADRATVRRKDVEVSDGFRADLYQLWWKRNETLPHELGDVLPTRFGNAVRAFETYSFKIYRADSIPLWLRLQALIPKDFMATINDAQTQVDFFINMLTLALLIGGAATVRLVFNGYIVEYCTHDDLSAITYCLRHDWDDVRFNWEFCVWIAGALILARGCYELAIDRAIAWGGLVKSAFDLYLPALARQLGYVLPETNEARRQFWHSVNQQFIYDIPISDKWPRIRSQEAGNHAAAEPTDTDDTG
jgi:hypothetical protein